MAGKNLNGLLLSLLIDKLICRKGPLSLLIQIGIISTLKIDYSENSENFGVPLLLKHGKFLVNSKARPIVQM